PARQLIDLDLASGNTVEEGSPLLLCEGKHRTGSCVLGVPNADPLVCVRDLDAAGVTTAARLAPLGGREVGLLHRTVTSLEPSAPRIARPRRRAVAGMK